VGQFDLGVKLPITRLFWQLRDHFRIAGQSTRAVLIGESVDGSHRAASCFSMNFAESAAEMVRWATAAEQTLPSLWLRLVMLLKPLPRPPLFAE
jgi:hypothetical protein